MLAFLVHLEFPEPKATPGQRGTKDPLDHPVQQAFLGTKGQLDPRAQLDLWGLLASRVREENQVSQDSLEPTATPEILESPEEPERRERRVQLATRVPSGSLAPAE